jgi:hypothetical protein
MRALVDDCQGREFIQVHDTAIIRQLLDSGERLGEIGALTVGGRRLRDGGYSVSSDTRE